MAKILLLEDEEPLRRILAELLTEDGHSVTAHGDGSITVDQGAIENFDVMITDLIMPEVDGLEAIRTVKAANPSIAIIAVSGGGRTVTKDYLPVARAFGASVILQKPFTPDVLIEHVNGVLAARPSDAA